jgi:hypothetical protein
MHYEDTLVVDEHKPDYDGTVWGLVHVYDDTEFLGVRCLGMITVTGEGYEITRGDETLNVIADADFPGLAVALMQWFGKSFVEGDLTWATRWHPRR